MTTRGHSLYPATYPPVLPPPPAWVSDALCAQDPPPVPLSAYFSTNSTRLQLYAKLLCQSCPVRTQCLTLYLREKYGIYGGLDVIERRRVIDAVRKGRKISDVLIRVDRKIREKAIRAKIIRKDGTIKPLDNNRGWPCTR